jgi:hypothetical protein
MMLWSDASRSTSTRSEVLMRVEVRVKDVQLREVLCARSGGVCVKGWTTWTEYTLIEVDMHGLDDLKVDTDILVNSTQLVWAGIIGG